MGAAFGLALGLFVFACGPSVSRVYEGDVRFERCMALDWQETVAAEIRRECWQEWRRHFTLGQTRDRIEYAERQLDRLANGDRPNVAIVNAAVPEPTSVFAPPPMMITNPDGGVDAGAAAASDGLDGGVASAPTCTDVCDQDNVVCTKPCRNNACRTQCANQRYKCFKACLASEKDGGS